jgi:hypothetical protein
MAARLGALADRIGGWNVIIGCLFATGLVMIPQGLCYQMVATGSVARTDGNDAGGLVACAVSDRWVKNRGRPNLAA